MVAGPPDAEVRQALPAAFEARYGIAWNISAPAAPIRPTSCARNAAARIYTVDAVLAGINTMFSGAATREKMLAPLKPELLLPEVTEGKNWKRGSLWFVDPEQQIRPAPVQHRARGLHDQYPGGEAGRAAQGHGSARSEMERQRSPSWTRRVAEPAATKRANFYALFGEDYVKKLLVDQKPVFSPTRAN